MSTIAGGSRFQSDQVRAHRCNAHLLTLSNGKPHPAAAVQRLEFPLPPYDIPNRSYHLRICGDYVGIIIRVFDLISDEPHTVFGVTNWKTGERKLVSENLVLSHIRRLKGVLQ